MRRDMEAGTLAARGRAVARRPDRDTARQRPAWIALGVLAVIVLVMIACKGLHDVAQTGLTGLSLGAIYALGAVGLTLVYGILKLVNFAHGDFLTFGAYMAYLVNVTWGMPLVLGIFFAMAGDRAARHLLREGDVGPDAGAAGRPPPAPPDVDRARFLAAGTCSSTSGPRRSASST